MDSSSTNNNQSSLSTNASSYVLVMTFSPELETFFEKITKKQVELNGDVNYFCKIEKMVQEFIVQTFFKKRIQKKQKKQSNAENLLLQIQHYETKKQVNINIEQIYVILKYKHFYRFVVSLYLISALDIKKEKLNSLLLFFYQLLNAVLKNIQTLPISHQIYISTKIYQFSMYIFSNDKQFFKNTEILQQIIKAQKNIHQSQFLDLSVSKISKILNSIICFSQELIGIKKIIKLLHVFYEVSIEYRQRNNMNEEKQKELQQKISHFYLKLLQKMEYKICKKLEKFNASSFDQEDILSLVKLILLNDYHNMHSLKKYLQLANDIFYGQNTSKLTSIKLSIFTNQLKLNTLIKKQSTQQNQGYGILCTIITILMKNQNLSSKFFKQKIFILCLNFIRHKFTNHVRLFNCIIECFSQQMNRVVMIFCLQFLNEETLKFMSVQKIKSLLKIIAQVANDSIKIKDPVKIKKKLFKVKETIKIFENVSNKYKEEETSLFFNSHPNSVIKIQNLQKTLSFMFVLDLHNQNNSKHTTHQPFKIIKFTTLKTQEYQLQLSLKTETNLQSSFNNENQGAQLNLQSRNTLQIKVLSNKVEIIKEQKQYISYSLQNSLELFIFVSLIKQPSKKYHIGFSIDGAYFQIEDTKNPLIDQVEFGSFQGIMKNLYFFNKELLPDTHKKYVELKKKMANLLQYINSNSKQEAILYKLNRESEQLILDQKKQKKFFFQNSLKCTYENVTKSQSITFLDILRQLGGLDSIFYLIQKMNQINLKENQADISIIIERIFKTLSKMASLDDSGYFLKHIEKSFNYINEFLFLLLKRNQLLSTARSLPILQSVFGLLIFFVNEDYRTKTQNINNQKKTEYLMFEIQLKFVKDILCNFELWAEYSIEIQLYIIRLLEEYVKNKKFTSEFVRKSDIHKKLIFSTTFYKFQKDLKMEQKITNICKILYENYLSLPVNQIFNFTEVQSTKKLQKKDLLFILEGCIHRDVNTCMSLIYYLLSSKTLIKPQRRVILNLCDYFIQNYIERDEIFKKINQDWIYVVYQLKTFLDNRYMEEDIKMTILRIIFCITSKSKNKGYVYLQFVVKSVENIFKNCSNFMSCFECALNILEMNEIFKLPVFQFLFQLLYKSLKNTDKLELYGMISENTQHFLDLISKLNKKQLTFCSQYVKFQSQLDNAFSHNFCQVQAKIAQTQTIVRQGLFKIKVKIFTTLYNEGIIQKQNSQWIKQFLNKSFPKQDIKQSKKQNQKQHESLRQIYHVDQKQLLMKPIHPRSNFKLLQYSYCFINNKQSTSILGLLNFFKLNGFFNMQPRFQLFHLTNLKRQFQNMMQGGLISLFMLKENKNFQELEFVADCLREINKDFNKEEYNGVFFCSLIIFEEVFRYLVNAYQHENQDSGKSQKPIQAEIRKSMTLTCLRILSKIHEFINIELLARSIVTEKDWNSVSNQVNYNQIIQNIAFDNEKKSFDEKKLQKQKKNYSQNLSKFCKKYLNDVQKNKKTDIFFKDFIRDIIEKVKYIETIEDVQKKIHQIYKFVDEKTQKDIKFVIFFLERLKYTGRIFLSAQKTLFVLHHYKYFMRKIEIEKPPTLKMQKINQVQIQPYTTILIQKFNKNLQIQKKKVAASEENWTKIQKANEFWLHQDGELYKNQFFQIDQKQTGPFGFYKLNIKPVKDKSQKINYPRRKKIIDQIAGSEYSSDYQPQAQIVSVQLEDSFKQQQQKKEKYKIRQVEEIQNLVNAGHRNTLLQSSFKKIVSNITTQQDNDFFFCEYITKKGAYAGKLTVKSNMLDFHFISHQILPNQRQYKLSTSKFHQINELSEQDYKIIHRMKIKLDRCELFTRRYIIRHTGIQLFQTAEHKSYFFNFFFRNQRDKIIQKIKTKVLQCIINRKQEFQKKKFTQKWQNGTISNFEYLMLINRYSGRSTNDLAQYPVLPWVIANYNGKGDYTDINQIFLSNPDNLRKLDCPPGKLDDQKFKKLKNRLLELDFCQQHDRFLYGTMFSNPTVLYNFFIRLQPFIQLHWQHQGKRIDHADRLFSGIDEQYRSVLTASSDMKQLTPQFYYWPQFLRNRNQIDLGKKQNKEEVNDVLLPVWAKTPEQFIFKMRQVLQSHEVSQKLHHWIDLTFGFKLKYEVAQEYDNLYHYNCYQKEQDYFDTLQDQKDIRSLQVSISEFGQIPQSIFDTPHPQKYLRRDILNIDGFFVIKTKIKQKNAQVLGFETCSNGLMIWSNKQVQFKRSYINKNYSADQENKQFPSKGDLCILMNFQNMSWVSLNEGILRIFTKKMMKLQENIDSDTIEIIGNIIFYAKKSQIVVSQLQNNLTSLSKKGILHGHKNQILYIKANKSLDILLSIDYEGYVMIHEMYSLQFLRGFQLNLQKQLQKKQLRQKDINLNKVIKVCIHQMGYFVFLIDQKVLLVYTFLGEAFLEQDIELSKKRKQTDQKQDFTDIQIFNHQKSLLLLSSSKGNIYMIDFIQIKRFNTMFPYKIYGRNQNNIISTVKKVIRQTKIKQNFSYIDKSIRSFRLQKTLGQKFPIYQIIVQYEDGQILCLYEQKYMGKQLKDNYKLKQIGLFY